MRTLKLTFFFDLFNLKFKLKMVFQLEESLKTEQIAICGEELFQSPLFLRVSCYGRVSFLLFGREAKKNEFGPTEPKVSAVTKSLHVSQLTRTGPVRLAANGRATLAFRSS